MRLLHPAALWGLVLIPLAVLIGALLRRRRMGAAVRYTNLDLLGSVMRRRDRWRSAAPTVLFAVAFAVLVVGVARPERTRTILVPGTVILALDTSGSMVSTDISPSRLGAATADASELVRTLPSGYAVGLVTFSGTAQVVVPPTTDRSIVLAALSGLHASGGTALGDALSQAVMLYRIRALAGPAGAAPGGGVLLLSDGENTSGTVNPQEAIQGAVASHVPIYTIALGTPGGRMPVPGGGSFPVPPHPDALRLISNQTHGRAFVAPSASTLQTIYQDMGRAFVGHANSREEATWLFAVAGLIALLGAVALSLRIKGRFP